MVGFRRQVGGSESIDSGGVFQRAQVHVQSKYRGLLMTLTAVYATLEMGTIGIYIWQQRKAVSFGDQPWHSDVDRGSDMAQLVCFYTASGLAVIFLGVWLLRLIATNDKRGMVMSRTTAINVLTSAPQVVFCAASFFGVVWSFHYGDPDANGVRAHTPWVPSFLRVWTTAEVLIYLVHFASISTPQKRVVFEMILSLMATMGTCVGAFQAAESFFGTPHDMYVSLYFTVVTFGTIGYGEIFPSHWVSQLIVVVVIVIAVYSFPSFFGRLAEISKTFAQHSRFSTRLGTRPHVIFAGDLTERDIVYFLNEFCSGLRKFTGIHIVVLSSREFPQEVRMMIQSPGLRDRVKLMVGDASQREDLERCAAAFANCIFVVGSDDRPAPETDSDVLLKSTAVYQYDVNLPQYVILRRERVTPLVRANNARYVLEKERLKFSLLGMGVISSGAIPLIINLVRSYDSDAQPDGAQTWKEQSEWSMGNELYTFECPRVLIHQLFQDVAMAYRPHNISVIGIVDEQTGALTLNPKQTIIEQRHRLLSIAADEEDIEHATHKLQNHYVAPTERQTKQRMKRQETVQAGMHSPTASPSRVSRKKIEPTRKRVADANTAIVYVDERNQQMLVSLVSHVLLIDLYSAHRADDKSPQTNADDVNSRARDLFTMARSIKLQEPAAQIVLLSRGRVHPVFEEQWRDTGYEPIYHVDGCGLHTEDLRRCSVATARGALIVSTSDGMDEDADTLTMLVTANVTEAARLAGRSHREPINIVCDIRHMDSLTLVPPYYTDDKMTQLAAENFAFEPAFAIGRVICSSMLDSALYQAYFNDEILRTVDALIYGNGTSASISSMPVPQSCNTYRDLEQQCLRLGFLPIALYRVIDDPVNHELRGHRFMFVNPSSESLVLESDHVYFLV